MIYALKVLDAIPYDTDGRFVPCRTKIQDDGTLTLNFDKFRRSACVKGVTLRTTWGTFDLPLDEGWRNVEKHDLLTVNWRPPA